MLWGLVALAIVAPSVTLGLLGWGAIRSGVNPPGPIAPVVKPPVVSPPLTPPLGPPKTSPTAPELAAIDSAAGDPPASKPTSPPAIPPDLRADADGRWTEPDANGFTWTHSDRTFLEQWIRDRNATLRGNR